MGFASATLAAFAVTVAFVLAAAAVAYGVVRWWLPRRNSSRLRAAAAAAARRASNGGPVQLHRLLDASATKLAAMIRSGECSSVDAVEQCIGQITRANRFINAVCEARYNVARAEAAAADKRVAQWRQAGSPTQGSGALPPFLGVPCSVKECIAVAGMANTAGLVSRCGQPASEDATVVARYKAAGFIVLCNTNTSELCMWYESSNKVYGRTSNPYSTAHIVGGSSGGEAALVAACGVPVGVGSDVGGSIRMPAFFNGVFGHKCSSGLIPNTGQHPIAENDAAPYLTTGPIVRHVEDLWPLVRLLAGPDGRGTGSKPLSVFPLLKSVGPAGVDMAKVRVLTVPNLNKWRPPMSSTISKAVMDACALAADTLHSRCNTQPPEPVDLPEFQRATDIWSCMLGMTDQPTFRSHLENTRPINILVELVKAIGCSGKFTVPALALALVEKWPMKVAPGHCAHMVRRGLALRARLDKMLGTTGVLLFPPHPTVAPVHHLPLFRPFNFPYTALFNVMELPVTQVPVGLTTDGLPTGVQIVGAHGCDHLTIRVAQELATALGVDHGLVAPPAALH